MIRLALIALVLALVAAGCSSGNKAAPKQSPSTSAAGSTTSGVPGPRQLTDLRDVGQLVFEVTAMLVRANFTWIVTGNPQVLEQARTGIRHSLERAGGIPAPIASRPNGGSPASPRSRPHCR